MSDQKPDHHQADDQTPRQGPFPRASQSPYAHVGMTMLFWAIFFIAFASSGTLGVVFVPIGLGFLALGVAFLALAFTSTRTQAGTDSSRDASLRADTGA
jgi:uncharacterized membrane protein